MVANPQVRDFDCVRLALLFQLRYGKQSPELQEIRKALSGGRRNLGDKGKQVRMGRGGGRSEGMGWEGGAEQLLVNVYCHFGVFSPKCAFHAAINHVIIVLERRSLT